LPTFFLKNKQNKKNVKNAKNVTKMKKNVKNVFYIYGKIHSSSLALKSNVMDGFSP